MTPPLIHVHPEEPIERGGWLRLSARVEGLVRAPETLWFDLEPSHRAEVPERADPFVVGLLFPAMQAGAGLHVHGAASRRLLENLEAFQSIWTAWRPTHYAPVAVTVDREVTAGPPGEQAVAMFSGGLDSAFTVLRHQRGLVGRRSRRIAAGLMVLGFDIPLQDADQFPAAAEQSRRMLGSIGVPLRLMRTNFREFPVPWEDAHGAALAACMHCFARGPGTGLIAASTYADPPTEIWGSNVTTDALLSSDAMTIANDAADIPRHLKPRLVSEWPEAMAELRVCFRSDVRDRNCGRCSKCVLTKLDFLANGLPLPASLEPPPTRAEIARIRLRASWEFGHVRMLLDMTGSNGQRRAPWRPSLEECLLRNGTKWEKVLARLPLPR